MPRPKTTLALSLLLSLLSASAMAEGGRNDHDRLRADVAAGRSVPLDVALSKARSVFDGRLIDARLGIGADGRREHVLRLLSGDGRVGVVVVDAASGTIRQAPPRKDEKSNERRTKPPEHRDERRLDERPRDGAATGKLRERPERRPPPGTFPGHPSERRAQPSGSGEKTERR